jgi:membrane associated rhomboid family serine protease
MLPLTDTVVPRRVPWVTLTLVSANAIVWLAYQLQVGLEESVDDVGFRACSLAGECTEQGSSPVWTATAAMFAHGGWAHLVGNMVFLLVLGMRVEGELGAARYALVYLGSGYVATLVHAGSLLAFASEQDSNVPAIGASGAISGVMGAYLVLFPSARIVTLLLPMFFLRVPAVALLAVWFAVQALEGTYGLAHPEESGAGIAFFAHVGGFAAGFVLAALLVRGSWPRALLGGRTARRPEARAS